MLKFRTRNSPLPVTKQFYSGQIVNPLDQFPCPLCKDVHADEFHYILICKYFRVDRNRLLGKFTRLKPANILTFHYVVNNSNIFHNIDLTNLAKFKRSIISTLNDCLGHNYTFS